MGSIQKKGMLCAIMIFLASNANGEPLKQKMCQNLKEVILICQNDLQDCREAAILKQKIADPATADALSKICYYVCLSEKTNYKKEEVKQAINEFLVKENCGKLYR